MATIPSACGIPSCTTCVPHRIAHWTCAQCGGGPFKFAAADPGQYKVLRPHFEHTKQKYVMNEAGVSRWVYTVRRICSPGCWQREARRIQGDELDVAQKRPDLAPAITAKLEAEQDAEMAGYTQDDLDAIMHPQSGSF